MEEEALLEIEDLNLSFDTYGGEIRAIRGVNLSLRKGEILGLVGESGSGKSTLAKAIIGVLPKQNTRIKKGRIWYKGLNLAGEKERVLRRVRGRGISMIFQDPMTSLNPTMTVGNQIMEAVKTHQKLPSTEAKEKVLQLLQRVGIKDASLRMKQYPHQFSGGMRQRAMIAIALACKPDILLADEPTTALDVTVQAQIIELLKDIQKENGMSIIFISHDLGVIANVADRVAVMYAGKIVEIGTSTDIFYHSKHPYSWGLLSATPSLETTGDVLYTIPGTPPNLQQSIQGDAFAPRNKYAMKIDQIKQPPMFRVSDTHFAATWLLHPEAPAVDAPKEIRMRGKQAESKRRFENKEDEKIRHTDKVMLEVSHLKKSFSNGGSLLHAVDDLSLKLYQGETFGLVGESGCGKSTLGRTIMGLYKASGGTIRLEDQSMGTHYGRQMKREFHQKVQMIFQDPYSSLDPHLMIGQIVAEGIILNDLAKNKKDLEQQVAELLTTVGLDPNFAWRYPYELSGGQRQRVGIARALAVQPELIIADEPISALDVSIQAQIVNLLKKLQKERGLTLLFIAHDLSMVKYISDRIGVMYAGKIVELAQADDLYHCPLHPYTEALISAIPQADPLREQHKKRLIFQPDRQKTGAASKKRLRQIIPGHFVSCDESEVSVLKDKYERLTQSKIRG
ncbi:ABC transporter ATP-binding protein [Sporolactobacillus terrae]|uniref:ABC transporter ATP-binding protein n=2 Tax=Sporolactobacillus terrae TaxID=269673 RepID=A0ABX5QA36_9BACL|nr:ABC transporter ATP-binding protein [Sporolactobacillus terrae]QAA23484.1 ABC transporter ATP-binding protein [Sporolactobacillus terrae]QAA26454.1 ABC transporter ATP-binding protein [Sporolactobacillus terrae]UAK15546.1 ABC transporter ATP-binding protein [Sporolactobacillus terrae]